MKVIEKIEALKPNESAKRYSTRPADSNEYYFTDVITLAEVAAQSELCRFNNYDWK